MREHRAGQREHCPKSKQGGEMTERKASVTETPSVAEETLPSAADLDEVVETTAKRKEEDQRRLEREAEQRKMAEIEALRRPVTISEDEITDLVHKFRSAAEQGLSEYVIFSFAAELLDDRGRAINNFDPEWPDTLTGAARGYYEAWKRYLRDKGYKISARVSDFDDDGLIKDISLVISW
jgi:hypothetical protein